MIPIGSSGQLSGPSPARALPSHYASRNPTNFSPANPSVSFRLESSAKNGRLKMVPLSEPIEQLPLPESSSPAPSPEPSVSSSAPVPSPTSDLSSWYEWIDTQNPLIDPTTLSATKSSSSSEAPPAASSTDNKRRHDASEDDSKVSEPQKKAKIAGRRFPSKSHFHEYFHIFYPVKSNVSYFYKGCRVIGRIKKIKYDEKGIPRVLIEGRKKWLAFDRIDVALDRDNNVMVFRKGFPNHVLAKVVGKTLSGAGIQYRMQRRDNTRFFLKINGDDNQMYKLIPFKMIKEKAVVEALKKVWNESYGIEVDIT